MLHDRLEGYLDEVETHLRALPEWERIEWREEARQHLADLTGGEGSDKLARRIGLRNARRVFGVGGYALAALAIFLAT